jgi:hypothetical protein
MTQWLVDKELMPKEAVLAHFYVLGRLFLEGAIETTKTINEVRKWHW